MNDLATLPGALSGTRVLVTHPSGELYGSDRMLLESVSGLVAAGAEVTVALASDGPLSAEARTRGAAVVVCPSPVLRKSMLSARGLALLAAGTARGSVAGLRLLRAVRPDVVLVNTLTIPLWILLPRLLGVGRRRPRVLCHVHEAEGKASRIVGGVLVAPLRFADRIVANSKYSVEVLRRSFPRVAARAVVVPNGVPGPARPLRARATLDGPVRLLYVGRLSERKGVDVAVEAVRLLRAGGQDATLRIAGAVFPGYEWFEAELREQIRSGGLESSVELLGFVDDVWGRIAEADIVLVPSRYDEPFGNTAVEALLGGRPVVVSDTSGLREAAHGFDAVSFVPPADPAAIADAVLALVRRWPDAPAQAWEDRVRAAARHSPAAYRRRIVGVVRELAHGQARTDRALPPSDADSASIPGQTAAVNGD
jgi:glycosyltransferase involved in cell wall biosynthesis